MFLKFKYFSSLSFMCLFIGAGPLMASSSQDQMGDFVDVNGPVPTTQLYVPTCLHEDNIEVFLNEIDDLSCEEALMHLAKEGPCAAYPNTRFVPFRLPVFPYSAQDTLSSNPDAMACYEQWGTSFEEMVQSAPMKTLKPSFGLVTLPEGDEPCPGVVLCHWREGIDLHHTISYADLLAKNGIASIISSPDMVHYHFKTFEEEVIPSDDFANEVPFEQSVIATSRIAEIFATHPRLAGQKLGIMGWSWAGTVALEVCLERVRSYLNPKVNFSACALFYPVLLQSREEMTSVPLCIFHGKKDTYMPLRPAHACIERMNAHAHWHIFEKMGHGFDAVDGWDRLSAVRNLSAGWVYFDEENDSFIGVHHLPPFLKEMHGEYLKEKMTYGAELYGTREAAEIARAQVIAFFKNHLGETSSNS